MEIIQNNHGQSIITADRPFRMIDNYIYLYHTDTLIALPLYPESIEDVMGVTFSDQTPMGRSAPIYSYSHSGPRNFSVNLPLHRDMMNEINVKNSKLNIDALFDEEIDYVDLMIRQLESAALPSYAASEKLVNPPLVAIRFGNSIFCKGVINGQITTSHSGPLISYPDGTEKYALVTISFTIHEVDPYDAQSVMQVGGYRGLSTTLDARVWR